MRNPWRMKSAWELAGPEGAVRPADACRLIKSRQ
jgi:hypothetical protein